MKLEKYSGNLMLSPNLRQSWESLAVCNPGVIYNKGTFQMLYRAAGNDPEHVIRFGLATSKDSLNFKRTSTKPILFPTANIVLGGKLFVYYGCADKCIGVATANFDQLVNYVLQFKS